MSLVPVLLLVALSVALGWVACSIRFHGQRRQLADYSKALDHQASLLDVRRAAILAAEAGVPTDSDTGLPLHGPRLRQAKLTPSDLPARDVGMTDTIIAIAEPVTATLPRVAMPEKPAARPLSATLAAFGGAFVQWWPGLVAAVSGAYSRRQRTYRDTRKRINAPELTTRLRAERLARAAELGRPELANIVTRASTGELPRIGTIAQRRPSAAQRQWAIGRAARVGTSLHAEAPDEWPLEKVTGRASVPATPDRAAS